MNCVHVTTFLAGARFVAFWKGGFCPLIPDVICYCHPKIFLTILEKMVRQDDWLRGLLTKAEPQAAGFYYSDPKSFVSLLFSLP